MRAGTFSAPQSCIPASLHACPSGHPDPGFRVAVSNQPSAYPGTSALVQLFIVFYVLPTFGLYLPAFVAGVAVLSLNPGAYCSEVVPAPVTAVDPGQRAPVVALNMPGRLAMPPSQLV